MGFFSGSTKQQTESVPLFKDITQGASFALWDLANKPLQYYPDQTYADRAPEQLEAQDMRRAYAGGLGDMIDPSMQAWQSMLNAPDVANNPYVQGMLEQQGNLIQRNLSEAMPGIQAGQLGVNQRLGGAGQGVAEGIATRGAMDTLARQAAATQMDAYQAGLGQQRFGLGAAPQMAQFGLMPANMMEDIGARERAESQLAIDEDRARYEFERDEPWMRMSRFVAPYSALTSGYGETNVKAKGTPSVLGAASQIAGMGAGLGGMLSGGFGGLGSMLGGGPFGPSAAYGALTGQTYGTNPYSMQSMMLADQMRGFN